MFLLLAGSVFAFDVYLKDVITLRSIGVLCDEPYTTQELNHANGMCDNNCKTRYGQDASGYVVAPPNCIVGELPYGGGKIAALTWPCFCYVP